MTDQPLLAKEHFLSADTECEHGFIGTAQFQVALAQIKCVFVRWTVGFGIAPEDLRVHCLKLKSHPRCRTHSQVETRTAQQESVAGIGLEAESADSFKSRAILSVEMNPFGKFLFRPSVSNGVEVTAGALAGAASMESVHRAPL
jgi:hypothetical protein